MGEFWSNSLYLNLSWKTQINPPKITENDYRKRKIRKALEIKEEYSMKR